MNTVAGKFRQKRERRQVWHPVKIDFSVQMIPLVLDHAGVKIVGDETQFFSASIQGLNTDAFVTRDFTSHIGNAQTTLPIVFHFFCQRRDLWIDEYRERNLWFLRITRVLRDLEDC